MGGDLLGLVGSGEFWQGLLNTLRRAAMGFGLATAIGLALGVAVARIDVLRAAIGSMITALQTMPSIAWFPLAILPFQLSENAIQFVVVLGAAPSIANGVITGVDHVPPLLLRAGRNIGASGLSLPSVGAQLQFAREFNDSAWLIATMVVIFIIGIAVDLAFSAADRAVRTRWGVGDAGR